MVDMASKKVIMVVGGSRGIGGFLVGALAPDYRISACSRDIDRCDTAGLFAAQCDVRNAGEAQWFTQATLSKFGHIDVMIYSAGLFPYASIREMDMADLDALYEVVVRGYLRFCKAVLPIMQQQSHGYIINIGSIRGLTVTPNKCAYSAMKRAAASVTESVRLENKMYNIKATSLHLGTVDTESSRKRYGGKFNHLNLVKEQDVLGAIQFLLTLSDKAVVDSLLINGEP